LVLTNAETMRLLRELKDAKPIVNVELEVSGHKITQEDLKLLEAIIEKGSIRRVSAELNVSYRTIWLRIKRMEDELGFYLVKREKGGLGGGKVILTLQAQILTEKYRVISKLVQKRIRETDLSPTLRISGSDCPGVELLIHLYEEKGKVAEYLKVGSQLGLELLVNGYSDLAGIHIIDPETGEYNTHVTRKKVSQGLVLIHGYWREIGFIVEKGNPKNIQSPKDLLRSDVVLANRNKGSGTHLFTQYLLREISKEIGSPIQALTRRIRGYSSEYYSHREAALAVLMKKADVTIGPRWVADELGLEFIPLAREKFDFATRKELLKKDAIRDFISLLQSQQFKEEASKKGIYISQQTGTLLNK